MGAIKLIIQILAIVFGCLAVLLSTPLFLRLRWPAPVLWVVKLYVSAISAMFVLIGVLITITGLITGSIVFNLLGIYTGLIFLIHLFRVTRSSGLSGGFERAFGAHWENRIKSEQKKHFLQGRMIVRLASVPVSHLEQNISFAIFPGTGRQLLCDIWRPPSTIIPSGLAFIYLLSGP